MEINSLVTLYFERSTALQNYWTLYVVVIGGLLAFSSLRQRPNRLTTILITVLFVSFAYKNCGAIGDATHQRLAVLQTLQTAATGDPTQRLMALETLTSKARSETFTQAEREALAAQMKAVEQADIRLAASAEERAFLKTLLPTLAVPTWPSVRNFHVFSDVLTVLALWSMEWRRRVHERDRHRGADVGASAAS